MGLSLSPAPNDRPALGRSAWQRLVRVCAMVRYRFFLYAGLLPYLLGAAWAYALADAFDGTLFLSGLAGVVLAVVGVEAFNEYFDSRMGTDRVFNPADLPPMTDAVLWLGIAAFAGALAVGIHLDAAARLADPRLRAARRRGGDLLRGPADPLGLPRPRRAGDRAVVRTVDGAGQPLPAHAAAVVAGAGRVAGARVPDHGARGGQRDPRLPPGPPRRQAQPGRAARAPPRRLALPGARRRRACSWCRSASPPASSRGRAWPPCSRCRCWSRAAASRVRPTRRRAPSCRRCATWSPATSSRCCCSPRASWRRRLAAARMNRIDRLRAPLLVSWQLTRDCDLCCLHCCTESAPGKRLPDELDADEAMRVADEIVRLRRALRDAVRRRAAGRPAFPRARREARARRASASRSRPTASASMQAWRDGSRACRSARCRSASTATPRRPTRASGPAARSRRRTPPAARCATPGCRWRSPSRRPASTCTRPGGHRAGALARRLPLQHRAPDAHRHRGAAVGAARAADADYAEFRACSKAPRAGSAARWSSATSPSRSATACARASRARRRPCWCCRTAG